MRRISATAMPWAPRCRGCMSLERPRKIGGGVSAPIVPQHPACGENGAARRLRLPLAHECGAAAAIALQLRRNQDDQATKSLSSLRMAAFGRAPTMVLTSSPFANTAIVGIDMT